MYDQGQGGSDPSYVDGFNNVQVAPNSTITTSIQADSNVSHSPAGQYTPNLPPNNFPGWASFAIDPDYANALYDPDVRAFMFTAINKYTSTVASPQLFAYQQQAAIPGQLTPSCQNTRSDFALGADQLEPVTGTSGGVEPWRAHTEVLMNITGGNDAVIAAPLFPADDYPSGNPPATPVPGYPNGEPWIAMTASGNEIDVNPETQSSPPDPLGFGLTTCGSGPDWMQCQYPPGSAKANTPLFNVAFPGSHDSVTGSLHSNGDWILKTGNGDPCSSYQSAFNISPGDVYNLGATQNYSILDQLDMGIRYFDMRSAYTNYYPGGDTSKSVVQSSGWSAENPTWRPLHTMFAMSTVSTEAQTIATWAAAHPDEIVIADYNHVCQEAAPNTSGFISQLQSTAQPPPTGNESDKQPGKSVSLCDVAYVLPAGTSPEQLPATTIQQVRNSGRNVIVLLDPAQAPSSRITRPPVSLDAASIRYGTPRPPTSVRARVVATARGRQETSRSTTYSPMRTVRLRRRAVRSTSLISGGLRRTSRAIQFRQTVPTWEAPPSCRTIVEGNLTGMAVTRFRSHRPKPNTRLPTRAL